MKRDSGIERNIRLVLGYDGTRYHGWQRQKNGVAIQGVLEENIQVMVNGPVDVIASGRTDAGVHAMGQVCHFITRSTVSPAAFKRGLNSLLPDDIFVKAAEYVPLEFHARYHAKSKIYEYRILNREEPDVFQRNYLWHIPRPLDLREISGCLSVITGRRDFSCFRSSGSGNTDPVRNMMRAEIHGPDHGLLRLVFEADGFLRHMVRNIAGTLVDVGLGKMDFFRFEEVLDSRDRRLAGMKAPAQGLFLVEVRY